PPHPSSTLFPYTTLFRSEVHGPHRSGDRLVRHVDADAVRAHRLDMGGPLLDEDDVFACEDEVGADRGAVRTGPDDRDSVRRHRQDRKSTRLNSSHRTISY